MAQKRGEVLPLRPRGNKKAAGPFSILVLSGPNLQLLGVREPSIYGTATLADIHDQLRKVADRHGARVDARQSNHEGDLVSWIGEARSAGFHGVVINPGAYTHTSIALLDAVKASGVPVVEVHLSNPESREGFRKKSYIARAVIGRVSGFGPTSYELGLLGLLSHLEAPEPLRREASVRSLTSRGRPSNNRRPSARSV
jgi:3-dehydroquinate dehydratase II